MGSTSYITNLDGEIVQHVEYIPFGEVFIEERNNTWNTPFLFNAKELDEETGLYYYGARYYNPRTSLWLSVDPLADYNPVREIEHYIDGQHNGGVYNSGNLSPYSYTYNNPVRYIDPNGKQVENYNIIGIKAHTAFANYMRTVSGKSGNWVAESTGFNYFRPDLLYYGGKNNLSGMGAVWELKPVTQRLGVTKSLSSVLQINHYVGELNARKEGGLQWATGTTALGTPQPFEGTLNLSDGKYNFNYFITNPEQGFIYYTHGLKKQPESDSLPQGSPVIVPQSSRSNNYAPAVGVGVGAAIILKLLDAIKLGPAAILPPMIISPDSNFNPADGYATPEAL